MPFVEIGFLLLILAFSLCIIQFIGGLYNIKCDAQHNDILKKMIFCQTICISGSFLCLVYAFIVSDFSVMTVADNSHTDKPLLYKIVGTWGNHEGSMLLLALVLSLYGTGIIREKYFTNNRALHNYAIITYAFIALLIIGFIIFTSNPFERLYPLPANGRGLNPLLQDIGLAIHPPLLYGGYIGFSSVFILAVAILFTGNFDKNIAKILHKWALIAWAFLTAGIGMGMWWAYYELGWGGFWLWDPVENASLMPWLAGTALLHSLLMVQKRGIMKKWSILLSILAFGMSMLGTFIVRSGIITSVHSFASSPERGLFILIILLLTVGSAILLYNIRSHLFKDDNSYSLLSKEGSLLLNNYLLSGILLIVFIGTLYPTFLQILGSVSITVGAPYFNKTITPIVYIMLLLCPLSGFLFWKKNSLGLLVKNMPYIIFFNIGAAIAIFSMSFDNINAKILILLGLWVIIGTLTEVFALNAFRNIKIFTANIGKWGGHISIGLLLIGIAGTAMLNTEKTLVMQEGKEYQIADDRFKFIEQNIQKQDNFIADNVIIQHINSGAIYNPQRRYFETAKQTTTEADIKLSIYNDLYITIGENTPDGRIVNIRKHPLVILLWGSMVLAVFSAVVTIYFRTKRNVNL